MESFVDDFNVRLKMADLMMRTPQDIVAALNSRSGYSRQAALQLVVARPSSFAVESIIERLNDWVPPVRDAAQRALLVHLAPDCFSAWLGALPKLQRLTTQSRARHGDSIELVEKYLLASGLTAYLLAERGKLSVDVEVCAFELVIRSEQNDKSALLTRAVVHAHPMVAQRLLKQFGQTLVGNAELIDAALRSRSVPMRQFATRMIGESDQPHDIERLRTCFFDSSRSVSATASFFLDARGVDLRSLANEAVARLTPGCTRYWLTVFDMAQRFGVRPDLSAVESAVNHDSSRVRAYALAFLAKAEPTNIAAIARRALGDDCRRVQVVAAELADESLFTMSCAEAVSLFDARPIATLFRILAEIQCSQSRWDELLFLLETRHLRERIALTEAGVWERAWIARSQSYARPPSHAQVQSIKSLLHTDRLEDTSIKHVLRAYRVT